MDQINHKENFYLIIENALLSGYNFDDIRKLFESAMEDGKIMIKELKDDFRGMNAKQRYWHISNLFGSRVAQNIEEW